MGHIAPSTAIIKNMGKWVTGKGKGCAVILLGSMAFVFLIHVAIRKCLQKNNPTRK